MSYRVAGIGVMVACVAILVVSGCRKGPDRVEAPGIDAVAAGQAAIEQYDTDGDGLIGPEELKKAPALKASMGNLDTNTDGSVSADEITARIESWQESRLGIVSMSATVRRRGDPLEGALVRLIPEEFLGPDVEPAEGTTDANGMAYLSIEIDPDDPNAAEGVHCGLYRVEITKEGTNIPAAYNTETTLGQEVANDAAGFREGIVYEIK